MKCYLLSVLLLIGCSNAEKTPITSAPTETHPTGIPAEEIGGPDELFPVFYGCFDWYSAVHGHWLASFAAYLIPDRGWTE